jgi:hypothetical protein
MSVVDDPFPIQPGDADLARRHPSLSGRLLKIAGGALVMIAAFFTTLWLTEPTPNEATSEPRLTSSGSGIEKLAGMHVSNLEELTTSAAKAGLRPARSFTGSVDALTRANEQEVTAAGWLADPQGDGDPSTVLVFVGGKSVARGKTSSERPDVAAALGLSFGAEKNVMFGLTFRCRAGEQPILVGIGPKRQYRSLEVKQSC